MVITKRHLIPACVLFMAACTGASAEGPMMPADLVSFVRSNGCGPVEDFYSRPGMIGPPYAYGLLPGNEEDSAVVWCKRSGESEKPFLLLVKVDKGALECPAVIEWWNYPGGLSLKTEEKITLGAFRRLKDPKRKAPDVTVGRGKLVVSYYDGASDSFYCYKGEWLVRSAD